MNKVWLRCMLFLMYGLVFSSLVAQEEIPLANDSFETTSDWQNLTRSNDGYYSPVDGNYYALINGGFTWVSQMTNEIIEAGATYTLSLYVRSANIAGETGTPVVQVELFDGTNDINGRVVETKISHLTGDAALYTNDDGANVWIDGAYRMQFSEQILYQNITDHPMYDPWTVYADDDYEVNFALGQVITPQGLKALFGTDYNDGANPYSALFLHRANGNAPNYAWQPEDVILSHEADQEPWVIDAHAFYDEDTERLWLSWGGHKFWVSELNPETGYLIGNPTDKEFSTHPPGTHTQIAEFVNDDAWSDGYQEGPALFKRNGYWYCFGSYGNLATNYTIRYGRATNPQGPYYDKNGVAMNEGGATLLFGNEGEQLVPGHPHVWAENGQHYIGYDYRKSGDTEELDYMGIRKLFWEDDWPTIYQKVSFSFSADDEVAFIGQPLGVRFRNVGDSSTQLALDKMVLTKETATTNNGALDELFAPPSEIEITSAIDNWSERDVMCYNWTVHESGLQNNDLQVDIVSHDTYGLEDHTHYAFVRYPENYDPNLTYPVIVSNHGGQGGVGAGHLLAFNGCYRDFIVVVPSFRGETLYTEILGFGDFLSEAEQSEFDGDIDDTLALLNCVLENVSGASDQNITVMGGSRGGCVSYLMAVREPRITRLADYFGATDHLTHPGYQERIETYVSTGGGAVNPPLATILNYAVEPYLDGIITLEEARMALLKRSVLYFDDLLPELVQIHHGAIDYVVEVEHSQRLAQKMTDNGIVAPYFEYFEYADGGHGNNIDPNDLRRDFVCNTDFDNDGSAITEDCDDFNAAINSTMTEIPDNGIDEDCSGADLVTLTGTVVQLKVFLAGSYAGAATMNTDLNANNLLPNNQPFNAVPWWYTGTETVASFPVNTVDWLLITVRDAENPATVLETRAALLLADGSVIAADGSSIGVTFDTIDNNAPCYITVHHRNHLAVISADAVIVPNVVPYSFNEANNVWGGTVQLTDLLDGYYALKAGDFNGDGLLTVSDFNVYQYNLAQINQYILGDLNLDGAVTVSDFNLYAPNASSIGISHIRY